VLFVSWFIVIPYRTKITKLTSHAMDLVDQSGTTKLAYTQMKQNYLLCVTSEFDAEH